MARANTLDNLRNRTPRDKGVHGMICLQGDMGTRGREKVREREKEKEKERKRENGCAKTTFSERKTN